MKPARKSLGIIPALVLLACAQTAAPAQDPAFLNLDRAGQLICTNLEPGGSATVQWASSLDGAWASNWTALLGVPVDSNGVLRLRVPMFYRVQAVSRNPDPLRLAWIPPGTFLMGSPPTEAERSSNEGPLTEVTISRGFWMGRHEVTQSDYLQVMGTNPSYFQGTNLPVESVSWSDATNYCGRLSEQEHLAGRLPEGYAYRLPTEAEWEYACRAGSGSAFSHGPELRSGMANFDGRLEYDAAVGTLNNPEGSFLGHTTPVGSYAANGWDLYDLHGNVWEWCWDWYAGSLPGRKVTDPQGPSSGSQRALRGGSWSREAKRCRSASRIAATPSNLANFRGFRIVLAPVL